jgi:hypothetical protein
LGAFYLTVAAWLNAVGHLFRGNFIRAALWFSIGCGMLFWWFDEDIDFDTRLHGSAVIVGIGALGTFVRWRKKQQAMQAVPAMPVWTPPTDVGGSVENGLVVTQFGSWAERE